MAFVMPEMVNGQSDLVTPGNADYPWSRTTAGYRSPANENVADNDTTYLAAFDNANPCSYVLYKATYRNNAPGPRFVRTAFIRSSTGADIAWGTATVNLVVGIPGISIATLLDPSLASGYVKLSTGSPVHTFGSQAVPIPVADGGTGAVDAASARVMLSALDRAMSEQPILNVNGDMFVRIGGAVGKLAIGAANQFLRVVSSLPQWVDLVSSMISYPGQDPITGLTVKAALDQLSIGWVTAISNRIVKTTAQTGINFTTETVITDFSGVVVPGTPNGIVSLGRKYRCHGYVVLANVGSDCTFILRARFDSAAGITGTEIGRFTTPTVNLASGSPIYFIPIPSDPFVPSATNNKVNITLQMATGSDTSVDIVIANSETRLWIEQIRN